MARGKEMVFSYLAVKSDLMIKGRIVYSNINANF